MSQVDREAFELFQQHGAECRVETRDALQAHFGSNGFQVTHVCEPGLLGQLFVHLKIDLCPPTDRFPCTMLYTTGMSDRAQDVPEEAAEFRFAELIMMLDPDWPGIFERIDIATGTATHGAWVRSRAESPAFNWIQHWMLTLARYPHATGRWIGPGALFPLDDADRLPGGSFTGFILLDPLTIPSPLIGKDGRNIALLSLVPLYQEEIELVRREGPAGLLRRFAECSLSEIVFMDRVNVALGAPQPPPPALRLA